MALNEYTLSVNEFLEPDVKSGPEAVCKLLVQLLLLEPNTYDTHPEMGVGIVSRYRYSFLGHADELQRDFETILISNILNLAAHYKRFFISNGLDTKVYLYHTDFDSTEFNQCKYNEDYRMYYLCKYNNNPKFVYLTDALKATVLPEVKIYCEFIPNLYYISAKNIEGSLVPLVIAKKK